jgi:uncharacterized protein (DUF885 family)
MKKILLTLIVTFLLFTSCKKEQTTEKTNTFNDFLIGYSEGKLKLDPIWSGTFVGNNTYNDVFPNFLSDEYQKEYNDFYTEYQEKLKNFKDEDLSESEQLSKAVLAWDCELALAKSSFDNDILMPINQISSINLVMGQLASGTSAQPFVSYKDYNDWLSRLEQYNVWLITAEKKMKEGIVKGFVLPKSLIVKVAPQFDALTEVTTNAEGIIDVSEHLFYSPIKNLPEDLSKEVKTDLTNRYTAIINDKLIPSFKSLALFLKSEYLSAGRETSGISDIPNGEKYYQHTIKFFTTTTMTADEIHELGLKEVSRILSEMEKVKQEIGFKGTLKEFFDDVRNNKKLMPYNTPEEVLANFNAMHDKMKPQLEKLFDKKPKTAFIVKQTEKFREASSSAEYNPGAMDGSRPGVFYVPIVDAKTYNGFQDEALFLHEAIPGHHYQISLTQESDILPEFRKTLWYSAYGEGWALYTENLGKELGLYTDPYQFFGMLGMEMHRAIRLVVDTGIHAKGWSREQAIQYSLDNEAESEEGIISEIERYMAMPGQALSYKIGQLKIRELRAKAKASLGDKFVFREFHNQVLETGCIPLELLENKIDKWIETSK